MRVLTIFGTRPEAIKMLPLVKALQADPRFDCQVALTAQHREMLDQVMGLFEISADYDLNIMQAGQSLYDITTRALMGLKEVIETAKPDLVLVHGDTTTTFVGALAAFYQQVAVGHVEAGLRSHEKYSPFPEEMNRSLTGRLSDLHFAPTPLAKANLLGEGIAPEGIYVTGNTVIDALEWVVNRPRPEDPALEAVAKAQTDHPEAHRLITLTSHRRENLGAPMTRIFKALRRIVEEQPEVLLVFPMHKNPKVRQAAQSILGGHGRIVLTEPMEYGPFSHLLAQSFLVLTDSGGMQEEAPALGKPVLVLRDNTERPEAIDAGTVQLVGTEEEAVYLATQRLLTDPSAYDVMARAVNPYGDGRACQRILEALAHWKGLRKERPEDYS